MVDELLENARAYVGRTLGKYHLEALLGVGGMAAVFAARHRNGNRVAIKVLHPQYCALESTRQRFLREGYVANAVDHPGAVRVLDDHAEAGIAYLVMELLEGETLDHRAERMGGRLPSAEVIAYGVALLDVLERAHDKGIIHRDIKPENVFLTTSGELKVLDFGIARLDDPSGARLTQTGATMGTPAFLAPEQALGHSDKVDPRTDLWAVGASLYWLLTGAFVHPGTTTQEILIAAATRPARPVGELAPGTPPHLAFAIDTALRFERGARFPSARAMRAALQDASARPASGLPVGTATGNVHAPATAGLTVLAVSQPVTPSKKGNTPFVTLAGLALLAVAGGAMIVVARVRPAPPPSAPAAEPLVQASASEAPREEPPAILPAPPPTARETGEARAPAPTAATAVTVDAGARRAPLRPSSSPSSGSSAVPKKDLWDPR